MLGQTRCGSPMNMAISGNRGTGKTSILIKFEEIAVNSNCICLRLSNYEGNINNIVDFSEYISTNLKRDLLRKRPLKSGIEGLQNWVGTVTPTVSYADISLTIEQKKIIVQETLRERLLKLWQDMDDEYDACVILIDEAESLEKIDGVLQFLREVFQRIATDANFMIVLAGKLSFPDDMAEFFSPLNRYFPCLKLQPLNIHEIHQYLQKNLISERVSIDEDAIQYIAKKSEGHPYVLVQLCYDIFDTLLEGENKIDRGVVERAEEKFKNHLANHFFRPMYFPLSPKAKTILKLIAKNAPELEFKFADAIEYTGMKRTSVGPYMLEMVRKGVLNRPDRGKYQLLHNLFNEYLLELPDEE